MPIKVLVISNYRATPTVRPEAEILLALQDQGFAITVMTYGDSAYCQKFRAAGIRVIDWHPEKKYHPEAIARIRSELQEGDYDILQLFSARSLRNGIAAAKGLPVKVVLYRGCPAHIHWYDPSAYTKFLHPRVDGIICNSEGVEEHIARASLFVKPRLVTINKGHDLAWYRDIEAFPRAELGYGADDFVVICAANNRKVKGIRYLIEAWQHLPPDAPIHLVLVGNDMDNTENQKLRAKLPQPEKVKLLPWRADSLALVKMADLFVLASLYAESITKAVMEAMSLGTAALITDLPGNRELLEHGKSGLKMPVADSQTMAEKILLLQRDRALCQKLAQAGQQRIADRFQPQQTALGYGAFYQELLINASDAK